MYETRETRIHPAEFIDKDLKGALAFLAECAFGSPLLRDISWEVARLDYDGMLVVNVTGDVSAIEQVRGF